MERLDEAVEWREPEGAPVVAGTFHGRAAVVGEVLARIPETWDVFEVEPDEFIAAGDRVIVTGRLEVRAHGTGGRAVAPFVHIWTMRGDRIVSWCCHTDTALLQAARTSR